MFDYNKCYGLNPTPNVVGDFPWYNYILEMCISPRYRYKEI